MPNYRGPWSIFCNSTQHPDNSTLNQALICIAVLQCFHMIKEGSTWVIPWLTTTRLPAKLYRHGGSLNRNHYHERCSHAGQGGIPSTPAPHTLRPTNTQSNEHKHKRVSISTHGPYKASKHTACSTPHHSIDTNQLSSKLTLPIRKPSR